MATSKSASKQASKQTSKQANKQANTRLCAMQSRLAQARPNHYAYNVIHLQMYQFEKAAVPADADEKIRFIETLMKFGVSHNSMKKLVPWMTLLCRYSSKIWSLRFSENDNLRKIERRDYRKLATY